MKSLKKTPSSEPQELKVELTEDEAKQMTDSIAAGMNPMFIADSFRIFRDNYHITKRVVWITDEICDETCTDIIKFLNFWNDGTDRPVYIFINSPGGSGTVCMSIVDSINALKAAGIKVYTINVGFAASAAAVIFSAGSDGCRYAYPSSRFMFHHGHYEFLTDLKTEDLETFKNELSILNDAITDLLVKVTGKTKADINKMLSKDLYMSVKEAKKFNIVNKIGVLSV